MAQAGRNPIFSFLGSLCICYGVGFVGAEGANQGLTWYQTIQLPAWGPPVWLFVPLWAVIYGLTGTALWSAWRTDAPAKTVALVVFGVSLLMGGVWPWLFFSAQLLFLSTAIVSIQWIAAGLSFFLVLRLSKTAGLLLLPYFLWVLFLAALNFMVWRLNPTGGGLKTVSELHATWVNS